VREEEKGDCLGWGRGEREGKRRLEEWEVGAVVVEDRVCGGLGWWGAGEEGEGEVG